MGMCRLGGVRWRLETEAKSPYSGIAVDPVITDSSVGRSP